MSFTRLSWRIGLPFTIFVLVGSIALVMLMGWSLAKESRARFQKLAVTNAEFINRVNLPPTDRMAQQLREVLGNDVIFRGDQRLIPQDIHWPHDLLFRIPSDRAVHSLPPLEAVASPLNSGHDLVLVRAAGSVWQEVWQLRTFVSLGVFWALAVLMAWLLARGLVAPLQHLAARLPEIELPGPLTLDEATRQDEIGDVARAFVRTRDALQMEKVKREHAEKLAVLGRMTAALAHEIQNPVAAIKMHAQLAALDDPSSTAHVIASEAARIEGLVNQWMFLSKPEPPTLSTLPLREVIESTILLHQAQLKHAQVQAASTIAPELEIRADRKRIQQVFSNLIINALQAMPHGGHLNIQAQPQAGGTIQIDFKDQGKGFSPEALARGAEFFFSEKEGGMGIGLSVCSEILKAHAGRLSLSNPAEGGALVRLTLPSAPQPA